MDHTPRSWFVYNRGYKYRVCVVDKFGKRNVAQISQWLHTQLGEVAQGMWIDQYDYICFKHEADALMFEMVWRAE